MKDCIPLTGRAIVIIRGQNGAILRKIEQKNLVVVGGYELFAALIAGEAATAVSHMAAGDSNIAAEEDQTDLQGTEQARAAITTSRDGNELQYVADFSSVSQDKVVTEFGLFNDATAGTMIARFVTSEFTLFSGQSMDVSWVIRVGQ